MDPRPSTTLPAPSDLPTWQAPLAPFAQALRGLVARLRPHKIVETGTSTGLGTTLAVCEALRANDLPLERFYSIEVNPSVYSQACENLGARGHYPHLLRGLSVPRGLLPTEADIRRETVEVNDAAIGVDYAREVRVQSYQKETDYPDAVDDLLRYVIQSFKGAPDLVILDSAGHLGFVEFQYVLSLIDSRCYFALEGVNQVKHYRSLQHIQGDGRFQLVDVSREKSGFCLALFDPE